MRLLYGMLLMLLLLALGAVAFIYSGLYNVAASDAHTGLTQWALHTTMHSSVEARAEEIEVPKLDDQEMVAQGARSYDALCVACHMKPGAEETVLRAGLNPKPPALPSGEVGNPAQQFWIVKHGIKMTGMPAWGETHKDQELWEMVAFLQKLPELSEQQYTALVEPGKTASSGQADDGHDHEHGDMSSMMGSSPSKGSGGQADDGHDHEHGDMSAMMGSSATKKEEASSDEPSSAAMASEGDEEEARKDSAKSEDGHYDDGHSH
nr:cytochrome c [uncultured Halomonas sp.]